MKKILITGCAGFIGFSTAEKLLKKKISVIGIDSINNYYSVKLKKDRLAKLKKYKNFIFIKNDLSVLNSVYKILKKYKIKTILHLAAQAGVRLSITSPKKYFDNNILAFYNILEAARIYNCKKIVFASSSSVYGETGSQQLKEEHSTKPIQFYATTKVCNEEMARIYSEIYKINIIGLRFFTVYGPWGRPDMAYYNFATKILNNKQIDLFNNGKHKRDFTYIDDVTKSIYLILKKNSVKKIKYDIYNIANSYSNPLLNLVSELKKNFHLKIRINYKKKQVGDVKNTFGNSQKFYRDYGFKPNTSLKIGIKSFCDWFKAYNKID